MKRYLLFAGKHFANGGWEDFISDRDNLEDLKLLTIDRESFRKKYSHRYKIVVNSTQQSVDWWEIVDTSAKVVIEKSSDR